MNLFGVFWPRGEEELKGRFILPGFHLSPVYLLSRQKDIPVEEPPRQG